MCLDFAVDKFQDQVISNRLDFEWPPNSPDLTLNDYWFNEEADRFVRRAKPTTKDDLKKVVEDFARSVSSEMIFKVNDNFTKRVNLCLQEHGAHFEHLMK